MQIEFLSYKILGGKVQVVLEDAIDLPGFCGSHFSAKKKGKPNLIFKQFSDIRVGSVRFEAFFTGFIWSGCETRAKVDFKLGFLCFAALVLILRLLRGNSTTNFDVQAFEGLLDTAQCREPYC